MRFAALLLLGISLTTLSCSHNGAKLCDNVTMREGSLRLSANERILVCGSSEGLEGWRDVPLPQAQYQIGILLQNDGYYQPRFERNQDQLEVWAGPRRKISTFKIIGGDGVLAPDKKRKVIGEPMTPDKLDEIEEWADTELRSQGFACPEMDMQAQAYDGHVVLTVRPGQKQRIASIKRSGFGSLDEWVLARYQAFKIGDQYDVRKTQLTTSRLLSGGLVQSAYFTTQCRGDEVDLHLHATVGEPKLLTFGVGGSTEELPFIDIRFRNTRLDDRASSFTSTLHLSPKEQSLATTSELYWLPFSKKGFFGPRFVLKRESENAFEVLSARTGADLGRAWDMWDVRFRGRAGPTLNYVNTVRGIGPDDVSYLSWEGSIGMMSNHYEAFIRDQYQGWSADFEYMAQREGLGSYLNVDRYELEAKYLWNVGGYAPPVLVLATRTELISVDSDAVVLGASRDILPTEYRIFYGGDENLRGFGRQVLNNEGFGYLTAAYLGFELRLIEELPYRLQPFLLLDFAKLGNHRHTLDESIFSSRGIGLRWVSPFGTLRGSAARGRITNGTDDVAMYPQEMVYFVSFGQEF